MPQTTNPPTFGMQFRSITRIADDEEKAAREYAARALETRVKRLQLIKEHIMAGGKLSNAQRARLSLEEAAYVRAIEFREDPAVKTVIMDIRQKLLEGITAARDGLGALIEKLEKK